MKAGSLHNHRVAAGTDPMGGVGRRETCPPNQLPAAGLDLERLWVGVSHTGLEAAYEVAQYSRKCLQTTRETQLIMGKARKRDGQWVTGHGLQERPVPASQCGAWGCEQRGPV